VELVTFVDALQRLTAAELVDLAFDLQHSVECAADEYALHKALAELDRAARRVDRVTQSGLAAHRTVEAVLSAARAAGMAAQDAPLRMAATAYEIFEFIVRSPQVRNCAGTAGARPARLHLTPAARA